MKKLLLFLLVCNALLSQAQTSGDYRSAAAGNWNDIATWERYDGAAWQPAATVPAVTDGTITIRSPHTVTINSDVAADQITIDAGGTLSDMALLMLANGLGTDLTCNGTFLLTNTLNGEGSVQINGIMTWTAGTVETPITTTASGIINMSTSDSKTLNNAITNAGTLTLSGGTFNLNHIFTNPGTINWSGGNFSFNNGSMRNTGTINNSSDGAINNTSGTNTFINSGTLSKTDAIGSTLIEVAFTNSGTLAVNSGTITNISYFVNTGTLSISSGNIFLNNGYLNLNAGTVFNGTGTLIMSALEDFNLLLTIPAGFTLSKTFGNVNGSGEVIVNGTMNWTGGSLNSPFSIAAGGVLNMSSANAKYLNTRLSNAGTITWSDGIFFVYNILTNTGTFNWSGGLFGFDNGTFSNSGTLNNTFDGVMRNIAKINLFTNSGTFSKTAGTGSTAIGVPFTNSGTLNVNAGTIANGNSFVNTGTINLPSGTTFINSGTLTLNEGTAINGIGTLTMSNTENFNIPLSFPAEFLLNKTSGTTNGSGAITVNGTMNWTGGRLNSPFNITATGILDMSAVDTKLLGSALNNAGVTNWSNGSFDFSNGTFANTGTLNNSFDGVINHSDGTNLFTNGGTFSKTGGTGISSININTQNTGILKGIGTLNFGSAFTNNGTIAPGLSPGIITVTSSSPVFTANSTLEIELQDGSGPGTGHDQLITGSATLNGNLTLTELGTVPAGSYTIISSTGTLTGTFSSITQPEGYTVMYNSNSVVVIKAGILPVSLVLFTATSKAAGIELKWQTATEQNTKRYIIERSADGVAFVEIGTVSATGNSNTARNYSFTDRHPLQHVSYYRLKSLDNDGIFEYSKIAEVSNKALVASLSIYPNPVAHRLMITGLKQGVNHTIQLIDAGGRIVLHTKTADAQLNIDMSTRMHGSYWVKIITAGDTVIHEILKP